MNGRVGLFVPPQESRGCWKPTGAVMPKMAQELRTELGVGRRPDSVITIQPRLFAEAILQVRRSSSEIGWYRVSVALVPKG